MQGYWPFHSEYNSRIYAWLSQAPRVWVTQKLAFCNQARSLSGWQKWYVNLGLCPGSWNALHEWRPCRTPLTLVSLLTPPTCKWLQGDRGDIQNAGYWFSQRDHWPRTLWLFKQTIISSSGGNVYPGECGDISRQECWTRLLGIGVCFGWVMQDQLWKRTKAVHHDWTFLTYSTSRTLLISWSWLSECQEYAKLLSKQRWLLWRI